MAGPNGSRMAGEKLSTEARNKQIREEIGNDPERLAERISVVDRGAYDLSGFSDKEINMALQGEKFDDNDYARLTGNTGPGSEPDTNPIVEPEPEVTSPTPAPTPEPVAGDGPGSGAQDIFGGGPGKYMGQYVNQDNDITSTVTGNNNTVTNTQDNSVNQYGGDSQGFKNNYLARFMDRVGGLK